MDRMRFLFLCVFFLPGLLYLQMPVESAPTTLYKEEFSPRLKIASIFSGLTCDLCKYGVKLVRDLLEMHVSDDAIMDSIRELCTLFKVEDKTVCTGIVAVFRTEILTVFDRVALSPDEVCGAYFSKCGSSYDPFKQNWTVPIPGNKPPVVPIPLPKPGSPNISILQISDMHYDSAYTPGLSNDCGEPLCCRTPNPKATGSKAAGKWGDYNCDVPYDTLVNMMEYLQSIQDTFDFMYWTGDLPAHNVWDQTREDQLKIMDEMVRLVRQYLPNKIVLPTLGNHESAPVNSFPPPFIKGDLSNSWLLNAAAQNWSVWLSKFPEWPEINRTLRYGGYYTVKIREGLRVISLQTNYCNTENYWLLINSTDPAGQLAWLIQQLTAAEANGEKVHIIGHIPPGDDGCFDVYCINYQNIVNRFESTIMAQFFGHTHHDEFKVYFDKENATRATSIAYIGPGVTSYQNLNLGFRVYTMDGEYNGTTYQILDHETYYANITDANLPGHKPTWQFEYCAKEAFGMRALHPQDWGDLVQRFVDDTSDDGVFFKYFQYNWKMHNPAVCDSTCKASMICDLTTTVKGIPCPGLPSGVTMEHVNAFRKQRKAC